MKAMINMPGRRGRLLVVLLVALIAATTAAWAYWTQPSKGSASGHVGTLSAPAITSATGGGESANLSWSTVTAPGSGPVKYYVSRDGGSSSANCPTSSSPSAATSCTDTGVPPGSHSYTVTGVWRSWTATSASKSVTAISSPTVTAASPGSRGQGAGVQAITVTGSHFAGGASTTVSGTGVTVNSTTFKSSTELTVSITVAAGASTGARNVTVSNADSGSGTGTGIFTVTAAPTITSTSPSSRGQGATSQTVAVKGSGFASGATSSFGAGITVNSTTFKSSTELTANITIESGASTGARTVTVTNPDAGVGSLAGAFSVNAAPNVESTNPSSRSQGASKQTVAIKGSGFVSGATSSFGSGITVESTSFVSSTELSVKISVESGAGTGARTVAVTNPDGGTDTLPGGFTVNAGPAITSPINAFGSRAKITHNTSGEFKVLGSGFVSGATVSIAGGFSNISVTFVNSGELKVKATAGNGSQTGRYDLTVTNPDGGSATSKESVENT